MKLLLFDLDGTLLQSDKTISERTLQAICKCRERGVLVGISTSRAEHNCMTFLPELTPDLFIASGGAVVKFRGTYIYTAEFSVEETRSMIACAREICGEDCEITIDTLDAHYWNYKEDPNKSDSTWGETIYTDFTDYSEKALKFCVEIFDETPAHKLAARLSDCDCQRFSGSAWYKFTKKEATKENAIRKACEACGIALNDVTAFGDDGPDIGMLRLCGTGVAMGNAIDAVKEAADVVIGSNDADGIAEYLEALTVQERKAVIRQAETKDLPVLAELSSKLWPNHTADEMLSEYGIGMANPDAAFFLAYIEETPIGFAQCQLRHDYVEGTDSSPVGYLEGIYVTDEYRKQGIARDLLTACESWAKSRGCTEFASDCELTNTDSLRFHLNVGFEEANRIICFTKKI